MHVSQGKDTNRGVIKKEVEDPDREAKYGYPPSNKLDIAIHESSWMTSEIKVPVYHIKGAVDKFYLIAADELDQQHLGQPAVREALSKPEAPACT